jgi:predicted phosphoribosyltransferase
MRFENREEAARALAQKLAPYRGRNPLVLAIPRGAAVMARIIADELDGEMDIVLVRKLRAPGQPELAIGAVTPTGGLFLDAELIRWLGVGDPYLRGVIEMERVEAERRERAFRGDEASQPIGGKVAIVVDDGLAPGATMRAARRALRQAGPKRLIAAAPVGSPEACHYLQAEADEVVCPFEVPDFQGVGRFYEDFTQTSDREVQDALAESHDAPVAGAGSLI